MNKIIAIIALLSFLFGCKPSEPSHQPGGPYYFKSGVTYQGYRPTGEITKPEADQLAAQGYAYYISHFDAEGKPTRILKVYKGETNSYFHAEAKEE